MTKVKVWDPFVRIFHWSVVISFTANAFFTDPESDLHEWIGYFIAAMLALRIIWGLVSKGYARFSTFPVDINASNRQISDIVHWRNTHATGHSPLGALMIYNILISLTVIAVSGYLMTTDMFWGIGWPEELHEFMVTWAEFSVVLHILAVIFESARTKTNIAASMVTGNKEFPSR